MLLRAQRTFTYHFIDPVLSNFEDFLPEDLYSYFAIQFDLRVHCFSERYYNMPQTVITKYPFVLITIGVRKQGTTLEQFREHNENIYAPLLKKLAGKAHPLAWTRRYHVEDGEGPKGIPSLLLGTSRGFEGDCFGEMVNSCIKAVMRNC